MWLGSSLAVAVAGSCSSISTLAWELPYALGVVLKGKKKSVGALWSDRSEFKF